MAEPSYYPLSPLKYPVEDASPSSHQQPIKGDSHYAADMVVDANHRVSRSHMFVAPVRPQVFQNGPLSGHPPLWRTVQVPLQMALLPVVAIGYLVFCYIALGRIVPVNTHGFYSVTPEHLATIKGGITSISIIIISIALYPICDIISRLKSEEFFRALAARSHGVPLETINHISTPTFGYVDTILATWRHRCSNYYILGFVASLLVWIASTLAPGILTVNSVLADGGLVAFAIGAVTPQSVLNGTNTISPAFNAGLVADTAAAITWAEMELQLQYSFGIANSSEPDYTAFVAPAPLDLSTTTSARWLSDVVGLNPTCSWASTNITTPVQVSSNASNTTIDQYFATAYLADFNLDVQINSGDIPLDGSAYVHIKDPTTSAVVNHTTQAIPSDGSTVFLLAGCSGCSSGILIDITLDFTGVNTTFAIAFSDETWTMAILACVPNASIETREVRNEGHGVFSVQPRPAGRQLTRQGNLNTVQTTALFSMATQQLTQSGGKLTGNLGQYSNALGSQVQADLLFGVSQLANLPASQQAFGSSATVSTASIASITQGYTRIIQSATKYYLAGYLGTAYVPGRISQTELVFAASIPHLAVSTAVFALLAALLVFAHFRSGKEVEFTLANIAASLHGSELPAQFAQANGGRTTDDDADDGDGETAEDAGYRDDGLAKSKGLRGGTDVSSGQSDIVELLGANSRIFMRRRADGSPVLHMG